MYSPFATGTDWKALLADKRRSLLAELRKEIERIDEVGFYAPGHVQYCGWVKYVWNTGLMSAHERCGYLTPSSIEDLPLESLADLLEHLRKPRWQNFTQSSINSPEMSCKSSG